MKKYFKVFLIVMISLLIVGCGKKEKVVNKELSKKDTSSKVGSFVKYNNDIYYWKLNKDSRNSAASLSTPKDIMDATNELVKLDSKGKETVVLKDKGSSELVISNNKIYTSNTTDEYENNRTIFSVDLKGENKKEIGTGFISDIIKDRYIFGIADKYNGGIFMIDTTNDEYKMIREKAKIVGVKDDIVYYFDNSDNSKLVVGTIKDDKDQEELISINASDFSDVVTVLNIEKIVFNDDTIDIYVGYRDGSANMLQQLKKYTCDYDGKNVKNEDINTEEDVEFSRDEVYITNSNIVYKVDNKEESIISLNDLASQYEMSNDSETSITIYKGNVVDNSVYFIVDYGTHDSSKDVGWRYAYNREKTIYFKYDISDKKLTKILEF